MGTTPRRFHPSDNGRLRNVCFAGNNYGKLTSSEHYSLNGHHHPNQPIDTVCYREMACQPFSRDYVPTNPGN